MIPDHEEPLTVAPEPLGDQGVGDGTPWTEDKTMLNNKWLHEWTAWVMDTQQHRIDNILQKHINDIGTESVDSLWGEWDQRNGLHAQENKLLATLVPIPISMILLFLGISWYRRRKSHQRRRRERLRRRHIIDLNMIRRQLERQTTPSNSSTTVTTNRFPYHRPEQLVAHTTLEAEVTSTEDDNMSISKPPSYLDALDTTLYPLVTKQDITEDLPAYCEATATLLRHAQSRRTHCHEQSPAEGTPRHERHVVSSTGGHEINDGAVSCNQISIDSPSTPPGYEVLTDRSSHDGSHHQSDHRPPRPPAYTDVFPNISVSHL